MQYYGNFTSGQYITNQSTLTKNNNNKTHTHTHTHTFNVHSVIIRLKFNVY